MITGKVMCMSSSLMGSLASVLPQVVGPLASRLGESKYSVRRGLETSTAALIATLNARLCEDGLIPAVLSLVRAADPPAAVTAAASAGATGTTINTTAFHFLSVLLGTNRGSVAAMIARSSGVSRSSADGILIASAPLLLAALRERLCAAGNDLDSFSTLIASEGAGLSGLLPPDFSPTGPASSAAHAPAPASGEPGEGKPLLAVVLTFTGLVLLATATWFLGQDRQTTPQLQRQEPEPPKQVLAAAGESFHRSLPGGSGLHIPRLGIENRLIAFIEDVEEPVDKTSWFDFDRLLFDTGRAELQPASDNQLRNIAKILEAFPGVRVRIGGYTDNVGTQESNLALSAARAAAVVDRLAAMGVSRDRMTSEGYGAQHPVADNSTAEGRARNRRISLRVTAK